MTGPAVIDLTIRRKIRDAHVTVTFDGSGYHLLVAAESFGLLDKADREAAVYAAIQPLPLGLLAKITGIDTRVA